MKKISLFGDSLLRGVILDENKAYRYSKSIDWQNIEKQLRCELDNRSRMGCTIGKGEAMLQTYLQKTEPDVVVLEYGGNDCDFDWADVAERPLEAHLPFTEITAFCNKLEEMITLLESKNIRPILMTLPPINAEKYLNWITRDGKDRNGIMEFLGDVERIYRFQERYSNAIEKIAHKRNVELVDVRDAFLDQRDYVQLMCEDGIHPNPKGQELIVGAFLQHFGARAVGV